MPCRSDGYGTGISPDGRCDDGSGSYSQTSNNNNMPCSDGLAFDRMDRESRSYEDTSKIDMLTQLLCEATKHLKNNGLIEQTSGELHRWYVKHEAADRKRMRLKKEKKEKESLRRKALSKLNSEEIKALGLA